MKHIGLFGGSFNPIHTGHIHLARQLLQLSHLDAVWLMVSPQNPLKKNSDSLLDDMLRYHMARIALHGQNAITVSNYEFHLPKPSYTWNTLQHLSADYPHYTFHLLIGADNWQHFNQWYRAADIMAGYHIMVYPRSGCITPPAPSTANVTMINAQLIDISSTLIRQRVRQGKDITSLVPPAIKPLVQKLYRT